MSLLMQISEVLRKIKWGPSDQKENNKVDLSRLSKAMYRNPERREYSEAQNREARVIQRRRHKKIVDAFLGLMGNNRWPLMDQLREMAKTIDSRGRLVGAHVVAVLASANALLPDAFQEEEFFMPSGDSPRAIRFDQQVRGLAREAHETCWGETTETPALTPLRKRPPPPLFGGPPDQREFAEPFFRVAALYHDMGKILSTEHHVPRGVHFMRDTSDEWRREVEELFPNVYDKRRFWTVLGHHDVFGVLTTGEASLPALVDMIGWSSEPETDTRSGRSGPAEIAMLNWLNMADSNAAMIFDFGGLTTSEAFRYLEDWRDVHAFLCPDTGDRWPPIGRDAFKRWALEVGSRPERTIQRIARLIATSYQYFPKPRSIDYETEKMIRRLVEQELQSLHGPRFEHFCYCFARFCKLDYGLSFFKKVMWDILDDPKDPAIGYGVDGGVLARESGDEFAIRKMVGRTCAILHRIVDEYGHLVEGNPRTAPRLGVDMSKLTSPPQAADNICTALKENEAGALRWIIDEISVWLYGG